MKTTFLFLCLILMLLWFLRIFYSEKQLKSTTDYKRITKTIIHLGESEKNGVTAREIRRLSTMQSGDLGDLWNILAAMEFRSSWVARASSDNYPIIFVLFRNSCNVLLYCTQDYCQNDPIILEMSMFQYITALLESYNTTANFNNQLIDCLEVSTDY